MRINNIKMSNQTFTSEEHGNKSNAGKYLGLGIGIGSIAQDVIQKGGPKKFIEASHQKFASTLEKELSNIYDKVELKELTTKDLRLMSYSRLAGKVLGVAGGGLAVGALWDAITNRNK